MLDFGLSKMALIGTVALVVLGPERLPRVSRTVGALFGRSRRYVDELKSQVAREMEFDELRRMKTQFESAVSRTGDAIDSNMRVQRGALPTLGPPDTRIAITDDAARAIDASHVAAADATSADPARRRNWRAIRAGMRNGNRASNAGSAVTPLRKARSGDIRPATRPQPVRFL